MSCLFLPQKGCFEIRSSFFESLHFSVSCGLYWAMGQKSLTRSVRSPPTSTLPTTTRRLHVLGAERVILDEGWGWSQHGDGFLWGVGSMGLVWFVLFCSVCLFVSLSLSLPFFSWDFSSSFTWTTLGQLLCIFYSSSNKVDGCRNILLTKKHKKQNLVRNIHRVTSGGSSEGKHGHPVSCENCLQRWILHHRVTRIYGDAWRVAWIRPPVVWGGPPDKGRHMGETGPMVSRVEMWLLMKHCNTYIYIYIILYIMYITSFLNKTQFL